MIVGCYCLDLYCHNRPCKSGPTVSTTVHSDGAFGQYTGRSEREAKKEARADGWVFLRHECYCGPCSAQTVGAEPNNV